MSQPQIYAIHVSVPTIIARQRQRKPPVDLPSAEGPCSQSTQLPSEDISLAEVVGTVVKLIPSTA